MMCRSIAFGTLLTAQSLFSLQAFADVSQASDEACGKSPTRPMRVSMRHIEPNGVGYNQGYTTLEGFFSPIHPCDTWVPFLDLRGHVFNNGKMAANAGLGLRYIASSRVYGINSYYDYRHTTHQHYNQVSAGLETLGRVWDFRINGYLPVGAKTSSFYHTRFDKFDGNNIILSRKREVALKGANAEAGFHLDHFRHFPMYFAAGPYYLTGKGNTSWGGEARVSVGIYDYVSVEGNVSYDSLFRWIGQGQLSVHIPFGTKRNVKKGKHATCSQALTLSSRSLQRVDRNEIVPVDRQRVRSKAIDPATGKPYTVWFVDNTSHSAGTFKSPFPTLLAAQDASGPNDIIYIFPGDQTTNGMDQGITLKDGQRLWGSAIKHSLPTTVGKLHIKALSTGPFVNNTYGTSVAMLPIITAPGDVVTIANNNEISGLYIQNVAGNGITGTSVSNLTVRHNTIQGLSGESILMTDLSGTLLVDSNTITAGPMNSAVNLLNSTTDLKTTISNNQIIAGATGCLWNMAQQGNLQFKGNYVSAGTNAVNIVQGTDSGLVATISDNQIQMFNTAFLLNALGANARVTMQNNTIDGGGSAAAIEIDQVSGSLVANFSGNKIVNYGTGVLFNAGGTDAAITLKSNIIYPGSGNGSSAPAIEIDQTAGSLVATINGNETVAAYHGVLLNAGGTSTTLSAEFNNITTYFEHGISIAQTAGAVTALVNNNTLWAQDNNGFNYENSSDPNSSAALTVTSNTIRAFQPVSLSQTVGSVTGTIANNIVTTNFTGPGIVSSFNVPAGTQTLNIAKNTVTQANGDGLDLFFMNAGNAVWNVEGNTFYGSAGNAAKISTNASSSSATVCVTFDDNTAFPVQAGGQGTYLLDNTGNSGTFTLNPPEGNVGNMTTIGVITGTCP